jgi:hypothetical protein
LTGSPRKRATDPQSDALAFLASGSVFGEANRPERIDTYAASIARFALIISIIRHLTGAALC